jgi:predicted glycosyltransferase
VLPRHPEQRRALEQLELPRCLIPKAALDSRSLLNHADLMIGAGGTMTREAALIGVPTLSLFAGRQPAVDRWLEDRGLMKVIRAVDELPAVEPRRNGDRLSVLRARGATLVGHFCAAVTERNGAAR